MTRLNGSRLMIAICVMAVGILFLQPPLACASDGSIPSQVNVSPTVESAADTFAFIRWTTRNPGGTILHYAIVHYGTDPNHLDLTAMSPTRINPSHSDMVFRVRMNHLQPETTYYYWVSSTQADGNADPVTSSVQQFKTQPANRISAEK
ncbi:MAG TPA: fibronectin type III domain-containing protein [Terriglobales bacterium]|nr:fibronectin type III domain-containing protein [Terriglobales bacterium]